MEFAALLAEMTYVSRNAKNTMKRREVAILLLGNFVDDISMYMTRHPDYDSLLALFNQILETEFDSIKQVHLK